MQTSTNLTTRRHVGRQGITPNLIVIHTMEAAEGSKTAENVAAYFKTVNASSHWCVDNNSRVRSVLDKDTAWTAPGANNYGLQIELAGYARQTKSDWDDAYSNAMLAIAAQCAAEWVLKYRIPIVKLSAADVKARKAGFAGHVDVSRAFRKSTHTDPGPNFPWSKFLAMVAKAAVKNGTTVAPKGAAEKAVSHNADGSITMPVDGIRGEWHIARWQEVMGTPIDGKISKASLLIMEDQRMLNEKIGPGHMRNLTGYDSLKVDGIEGRLTILARQWWLRHTVSNNDQINLTGHLLQFDGELGKRTNLVHQYALNNARIGSKVYPAR